MSDLNDVRGWERITRTRAMNIMRNSGVTTADEVLACTMPLLVALLAQISEDLQEIDSSIAPTTEMR